MSGPFLWRRERLSLACLAALALVLIGRADTLYTFSQSSDPQGIISDSSAWVALNSTCQTVMAPQSGSGYYFAYWIINDVMATDVLGQAAFKVSFALQSNTVAIAHYLLPSVDTDGDGTPDYLEWEYFGSLTNSPGNDVDGDGFDFNAEITRGYNPAVPDEIRDGGVMIRVSDVATYRQESIEKHYDILSDPQGIVSAQGGYLTNGATVSTSVIAMGASSGYYFGYWTVNGVRQAAGSGLALSSSTFTLGTDTVAVAHFFAGGDSDGDGMADWQEQYWFGNLDQNLTSDPDGDGFTIADELVRGYDVLIPDDLRDGGVMMRVSDVATYRQESIEKHYDILSDPQGIVSAQSGYKTNGATISTPVIAMGASSGYYFGYWTVNGVRQAAGSGLALSSSTFTLGTDTVAVAHFFAGGDSDADGMADWQEQYWFGNLNQKLTSDPDGDGFTIADELARGYDVLIPDDLRDGGVMMRVSDVATYRQESVEKRYDILSDPQGIVSAQSGYKTNGAAISTPVIAMGASSGYYFGYWTVNGVRQAAGSGLALSSSTFTLGTDTVAVAHFFAGGDSDADGMADWQEQYWFGNLNQNLTSDPDGDGFTIADELARGYDVLIPDDLRDGGVMMRLSDLKEISLAGYLRITLQVNPPSGGTVMGGGIYPAGLNVQITAIPASGWAFVGWSDGDANATRIITVPGTNITYTASFAPSATISVGANTNIGGTVTGSGTFLVGSTNWITATASNGWAFVGWSDGVTNNPRSIVVVSNATYAATFACADQTITFDAIPDQVTTNMVTVSATASSGLPVSYCVINGPAVLNDSTLTFTNEGVVSIVATQSGNSRWNSAIPVTNTFSVVKTPTAIMLDGLSQTYNGSGLTITPTAGQPGLTLDITYDGSATAPTAAGSYQVIVAINDGIYSGSVTGTLVIAKANQTITFASIADQVTTNSVALSATASSGLPVTLAVVSGPVTLVGSTLTFSGAGDVTVEATQVGNGNWNAATAVTNTCTVSPTAQTISFAGIADQLTTNTLTLGATASSTLPVSFELVSGANATLVGNALTFTGEGTVSVRAIQAGDAMWSAAEPVTNTFAVTKTLTSITLDGLSQIYNGAGLVISGTPGQPGLALQITYDGSTNAPVNAGAYTVIVTIQDGMYQGCVTGTLTIAKADQTITFGALADQVTTNTLTLGATASSGLPVSFSVVSGPGVLNGADLTFTSAGAVDIVAAQGGNGNWNAAAAVTNTVAVSLTTQTINFPPVADVLTTDTVPFNATASSGLSVTYQLVSGPGRAWVGNALTFTGEGTVSVRAIQAGDAMWSAAEPVTNTFAVTKTLTSITLDGLSQTYNGAGLVINGTPGQPGLALVITYDGSPTAPVNAGTYQVIVTVQDNIYQGCVTGMLTIAKASQVITFSAIPDQQATNEVLLAATATSGLPVSFSVASGPAEWDGTTLTFTNMGPVRIVATQSGNGNWNAAPDVTNTFNVTKTPQTITFPTPGDQSITNAASLSATASRELPVSFNVVDGPGLVSDGTNLTFNGVGPVSIVATQAGDGQWALATPVTNTINVAPYPAWQKPDFVVDSITTIPATPALGGMFMAVVTIRNGGFARGNACTVKVWAHHPATATSNEVADASQTAGTLNIGETNVVFITGLTAPSVPGTCTLRAFVDGNDRTPEASEGNNQTTLTYYPAMPDFVVTAITLAPTTLTNGNTFAATVTVKNQGTVIGNAGLLRIWLSHGTTAVTNEPGDAAQTVGSLAAGESKDLVFSGLIATNKAGSYYLRAFVDANNATFETSDVNNQNTLSYTVAAAGGGGGTGSPDFTVTAIALAPTALTNGNTFAATVTVMNTGAVAGDAGLLRIWLSHGATAVTNEPGDGEQAVGTLAVGASTSLTFTNLTAPALAGTHYLRAFVDADNATAEASEGNNQNTLAYTVASADGGGGTGKPDFTITAISIAPTALTNGNRFAATVTVMNTGAVAGDAGLLRIWLSHGATAVTNEPGDGEQAVGTLAAGASASLTFTNLTAPASAGTYYFRAFVDANNSTVEQSEGNNQSTLTYTVVASGAGGTGNPDFTITAITIAPTALTNGNKFAATVTVKNQGSAAGNAGVLKLWLSHGATATTNETGDMALSAGTLAAGASVSLTFTNLTAPAAAGTYYLRAFVDGNNATVEQSEGNNQSTLTYTVTAAGGGSGGGGSTGKPDFLVTAISFSPTNLTMGCTFTAYVTIVNNGPAAGNAGALDIYLNRGATAIVGLAGDANQTIGTLASVETRIVTFTGLTAPATKGTYYFRAFIDSQGATDEQSEGNNQKTKTYGFY